MEPARHLSLDEAYEAAFVWLDAFGELPSSITEPAANVIEMRGESVLARIRWSETPVAQGAVLALLRAADEPARLILFSPSGFSAGARTLAESQGVALFRLDADGRAVAVNSFAELLQPDDVPAPFAPKTAADPAPPPTVTAPRRPAAGESPAPPMAALLPPPVEEPGDLRLEPRRALGTDATPERIACPECGFSHGPTARFCTRCGADLRASSNPAPSTPPRAAAPTLRCRTCGSHDIELIYPESPARH